MSTRALVAARSHSKLVNSASPLTAPATPPYNAVTKVATARAREGRQDGRRQTHAGFVDDPARLRHDAAEPVEERRLARQVYAVAPRQDPVAAAHEILHYHRLARFAFGVKRTAGETGQLQGDRRHADRTR